MTFSCRLNSLSFGGLKMLKEQHKFRFSITVECIRTMILYLINYMGLIIIQGRPGFWGIQYIQYYYA